MTAIEITADLGARLRRHRLALGLTQTELAQRAALSVGTVQNLESRAGASSVETMIRVARVLGLIDQVGTLFAAKPRSIAEMEKANESPRIRARRRKRP
jgi:transcriptional regulator with XRE-family HTH domain